MRPSSIVVMCGVEAAASADRPVGSANEIMRLLNVGCGNVVAAQRIVAISQGAFVRHGS